MRKPHFIRNLAHRNPVPTSLGQVGTSVRASTNVRLYLVLCGDIRLALRVSS